MRATYKTRVADRYRVMQKFRDMLDEQGIEWRKYTKANAKVKTTFEVPDGDGSPFDSHFCSVEVSSAEPILFYFKGFVVSPEAAIEAAFDRKVDRVCHYLPDFAHSWFDENGEEHDEPLELDPYGDCLTCSCDVCGYTMMAGECGWFDETKSEHGGIICKPRFKHCPECGRKVVDK